MERRRVGDFSMEELRPVTVDVDVNDIDVRLSLSFWTETAEGGLRRKYGAAKSGYTAAA
jgi:hypothetical protein